MPRSNSVEFGAEARGTVPQGVTGAAVIPPGRYWLDLFGANIEFFQNWAKSKPEVRIESTEQNQDISPAHAFVIFSIPPTANNYGMPGVLFPTVKLGFPEIADSTVHSSDDTVQKPPPPSATDVLHDAGTALGGAGQGLVSSLSTGTMLKIGLGVAAILLLKKAILL